MKAAIARIGIVAALTLATVGCSAGVTAGPSDGQPTAQAPKTMNVAPADGEPPRNGEGKLPEPRVISGDVEVSAEANGPNSKADASAPSQGNDPGVRVTGGGVDVRVGDGGPAEECGTREVQTALSELEFTGHCKLLVITGAASKVTFETADEVRVEAAMVTLKGQSVDKLTIAGASNEVEVDKIGDVTIMGSMNTINAEVTGEVRQEGMNNTVGKQ